MRSTSAAPASSLRARWSTEPNPLREPGVSESAAIELVLIPMMSQPARQEALAAFFLEDLVHEAMVLGGVACERIQNAGAELQGEGPLPHFPEFVVVLPLRPHDGNLVDGRVVEANLAVDGANGGLTRFRIGDVKAHWAGLQEHRAEFGQLAKVTPKDVTERMRHKAQADGLSAGGAQPVAGILANAGHLPGNSGIVKEEQHRAIRAHLQLHLGEHIAQPRTEQALPLEQ